MKKSTLTSADSPATKNTIYTKQKLIDAGIMLLFLTLVILATLHTRVFTNRMQNVSFLDALVLILATFRLMQLFMKDNVMQWFRDLFFNTQVKHIGTEYETDTEKPTQGVRREVAILLGCPWCTSVWVSFGVLYVWIMFPVTHFFLYIMALSGISSVIYIAVKKMEK